jgi:DNA-binding LacI/PurR family transcriptional regulator
VVTIRDVARLAGVSPATVSQALNGHPRVNAGTRQRVVDAAVMLRYAPNLHGRRLARRRAECLAIVQGRNVATVFSDSFFRVVLGGVAETAQARGYSLVITPAPRAGATRADVLRALGHGAVDGALVVGAPDEDWLVSLLDRGLPVVLVDTHVPGMTVPAVSPDYREGARLATAHLLAAGHRRVALLGAAVDYPFGRETHDGYREALAGAGVAHDPALVARCEIAADAAAAATRALLDSPGPPTAIFAVTDAMAIWAIRAARERGVRVPADLAVAGMDDIELAAYVDPPLTTVRIGKEEMGRVAAERLVALIEGGPAGAPVPAVTTVSSELIVRRSCGAGAPGAR